MVFCQDITEFVQKVQKLRGFPSLENVLYKIYIDEGQGKLMVSLSIIEWMCPESEREKGTFKSSGVKKIFLLACAPCKDAYNNARLLLSKIQLQKFPYHWKLCSDLKFINEFCGIGPHSSSFPCYICTWKRGSLEPGSPRTFASIKEWFDASQTSDKGQAKDYFRL